MILGEFPECDLRIMFGDDKKALKEFGDFLIKQEDEMIEDQDNMLLSTSIYDDKIDKIRSKKMNSIDDIIKSERKIRKIKRKMKKNLKYSTQRQSRDLSIASYLNDKKYKKKFLDRKKYRKHMENIAKAEKKERKEMKRLGYIHSNDPDKELNRLKINKINEQMLNAISDAYTQKHFI